MGNAAEGAGFMAVLCAFVGSAFSAACHTTPHPVRFFWSRFPLGVARIPLTAPRTWL